MPSRREPLSEAAVAPASPAALALIVIATLAAYANSFGGALVFDDIPVIRDNPSIRSLWPLTGPLSPPSGLAVTGRPLLNLSFALSYALSGLKPWGYHALNLAFLLLAALALYGVVRRTLRTPSGGRVAAAAALLWALHPLLTGSVTYVAERSEEIMGLCYLAALYCFIRYAEGRRKVLWGVLGAIVCVLGTAAKEVMVTAPVLILLYDRTFVSGTFRGALRRHWPAHLGIASTWPAFALMVTGLASRGVGAGLGVGRLAYAAVECRAVLHYLRLAVWPVPLVLDYGPAVGVRVADGLPWLFPLAALAAGVVWALWKKPAVGFLGAWVFVTLAPTSSLVPIPLQPVAENRMYLALAAVAVLAASALDRCLRLRPALFLAVTGASAAALGAATAARNAAYGSAVGLWQDTVAERPGNFRAHYNLAEAFLDQGGQGGEAVSELRRSIQLYPYFPDAHYRLGLALGAEGRLEEEAQEYGEALKLKPDYAQAHAALGIALFKAGRPEEALPHFEQAARLDPSTAETRVNLAIALLRSGQPERATGEFQAAIRLRPDSAPLRNRIGVILAKSGRSAEAEVQFQSALRLDPRNLEARVMLGSLLANESRMEEAAAQFEQAVQLDPHEADTHERLGAVLRALGRSSQADEQFAQAAALRK